MTKSRKRNLSCALALALLLGLVAPVAASALSVYAASSLRDVFTQIDSTPEYSFQGSNALQLQIARGAPADVFASASSQEPRALFKDGHCKRPVTFATNKLALLVPNGNPNAAHRLRACASTRAHLSTLESISALPSPS